MKNKANFVWALLVVALVLLPKMVSAMWMEQSIPLVAGWNAVHLKVNPVETDCAKAFAGTAVTKVSWWNRDRIADGTPDVPAGDFRYWYASGSEPNSFSRLIGDQRYLVHCSAAMTLTVKGTPAIPSGRIYLGELNLVGANAVPGVFWSEYFQDFGHLSPSPYAKVLPDGTPQELVSKTRAIGEGQAIWLNASGEGEDVYTGPVQLSTDSADKVVKWSGSTAARTITVKNVTGVDREVTFSLEDSLDPPPGQGVKSGRIALKRETVDTSAGYLRRLYEPLALPFSTNLAAGASFALKVRPNAEAMAGEGAYLGILKVETPLNSDGGVEVVRVGLAADGDLAEAASPAGLWVGNVALNAVNRAKMVSSSVPEWNTKTNFPTSQAFQFRLIVHVADDGTTRLLKQAFVGSDGEALAVMADRATAKAYRKNHPSATIRRVSSANFPFETAGDERVLAGCVFMQSGGVMSSTFTQFFNDRTNPFHHVFHPDHDNIFFRDLTPVALSNDGASGIGTYESWNVTRAVSLEFQEKDPVGAADEDWGKTVTGGIYRETISGLIETDISVEGAFRLSKVADTPVLSHGGVAP